MVGWFFILPAVVFHRICCWFRFIGRSPNEYHGYSCKTCPTLFEVQ